MAGGMCKYWQRLWGSMKKYKCFFGEHLWKFCLAFLQCQSWFFFFFLLNANLGEMPTVLKRRWKCYSLRNKCGIWLLFCQCFQHGGRGALWIWWNMERASWILSRERWICLVLLLGGFVMTVRNSLVHDKVASNSQASYTATFHRYNEYAGSLCHKEEEWRTNKSNGGILQVDFWSWIVMMRLYPTK